MGEMMTITGITSKGITALNRYRLADAQSKRAIYREVAERMVDLRALFTHEGRTDWRGQSFDYRMAVNAMVEGSNLNSEERKKIMPAIRYHLGDALRERLPDSVLKEYGLFTDSPRERAAVQRKARSTRLNALRAADPRKVAEEVPSTDPEAALEAAIVLLKRIAASDLSQLSEPSFRAARKSLQEMQETAMLVGQRFYEAIGKSNA